MPELPEVECLSRAIKQVIQGHTITEAHFYREDLRGPIPMEDFRSIVVGQVIKDVWRRSKYMLWETQLGYGIIHLGMTGQVLYRRQKEPEFNHTHAVFTVASPSGKDFAYLHYVDPRRFGWISCCTLQEYAAHPFFAELGPEPLGQDRLVEDLWEKSRHKKVAVKNFLMNAKVVVGVGNIYASEALFRAGVRPTRPAGKLRYKEMEAIVKCIRETLVDAIDAGGTSFRDYRHADGGLGYFAQQLNVYGRKGEPCRRCEATIKGLRQANRATFYCPSCQK